MKTRFAVAVVFVIASVTTLIAQAQVVQNMTPETIREAIAFGMSTKDLKPYRIQEKARFTWPPLIAEYTTPFLRVALAANAAKKRYQPFTEADVKPEMTAPEIQVYASSQSLEGTDIANVETIVVLPFHGKGIDQAIHPTRISDASEEYKNLFGFSGEGRGVIAVFPLNVWREGDEVHVVFDKGIPSSQGPGHLGGCTDCKSRIYLDKVR